MTVKKLSTKKAEEFIQEGGKPSRTPVEEMRFTLRIPSKLMELVDESRNKRIGKVSKNNWILEAIKNQIDVDKTSK